MSEDRTYKIGEVAAMLNINTSALRYWEEEFPQINSIRTDSGQRRYTESHIFLIKRIYELLYRKGMTIEGARRELEHGAEKAVRASAAPDASFMGMLEEELLYIKKLLAMPAGQ